MIDNSRINDEYSSKQATLPVQRAIELARQTIMDCDLDTSVPDWIIDHPETAAVFKALGIDTSCGGKSLEYVCRQQGFDPQDVLERLFRLLSNQPVGKSRKN